MGEIRLLDKTGDLKVMWDKNNVDEVNAAKEQFNNLIDKGYTAFSVEKDGGKGKKVTEFDKSMEKIIMVPIVRGG